MQPHSSKQQQQYSFFVVVVVDAFDVDVVVTVELTNLQISFELMKALRAASWL